MGIATLKNSGLQALADQPQTTTKLLKDSGFRVRRVKVLRHRDEEFKGFSRFGLEFRDSLVSSVDLCYIIRRPASTYDREGCGSWCRQHRQT